MIFQKSFVLLTFTLTIFFGGLSSVTLGKTPKNSSSSRLSEDNITHEFARLRKLQVQAVAYDLSFNFASKSEEFSGKTVIDVTLNKTNLPLSVDFITKKMKSIYVNGAEVKDLVTREGSFDIPAKYLAQKTQITIEYEGGFNKEGHGFQRVVDPEDSSEYLYTDFEPYYAHTMFPCFDQPDLKATFRVGVNAPKEWKLISNDLVEDTQTAQGVTRTTFAKSQSISTYLFFLGAGPFTEWTDKAEGVPLSLYARKTLAKHVDHKKIFETTKKGLKFFNDYFGMPYPFPKYGQIFIPEFAWGGMENPGAVTLNERGIFRGAVSETQVENRDSLILHEMAHMWFGDLVTMSWWNDLWLNESFASYLAHIAQERALQAKGVKLAFFGGKTWGYWQDQLVTTHPIETEVADVRTTKGNFDGITYAKGAASLQQLHFHVGEEGFREGLRSYFKKFSFQNTTRENFISEIGSASKKDLKQWTKTWLQTSGPNRVQIQWACDKDQLQSFKMIQYPSVSKTLSPHKTRVGLYKAGSPWKVQSTQDIAYAEKVTAVSELVGKPCPDFVYPNVDDQDYALFSLDAISLKAAKEALVKLEDPLLRLMIWNNLGQMVRDSQLPLSQYFEFAQVGLENEKSEALLGALLDRHSQVKQFFFSYLTAEERDTLAPEFEDLIWKRVMTAAPESNAQISFFDFYVEIVQTTKGTKQLHEMLLGKGIPKGIKIDQDRRWNIIETLAARHFENISALIDNEEKKDPSTTGKRSAYGSRAAIPSPEGKQKFWAEFQKPDQIPNSNLRVATGSFNNPGRTDLSEPFVKPFFQNVLAMDWKSNDTLVEIYFENLFPQNICSGKLLHESETRLKSAKNLTPLARRSWREANDELSKCIAIRKKQLKPNQRL